MPSRHNIGFAKQNQPLGMGPGSAVNMASLHCKRPIHAKSLQVSALAYTNIWHNTNHKYGVVICVNISMHIVKLVDDMYSQKLLWFVIQNN